MAETSLPSSSAVTRSPSVAPPSSSWTPEELAILASLARICPRGDPRWSNERFVDAFLMGRLRARRDVAEVMAWGQIKDDPSPSPPPLGPSNLATSPSATGDEAEDRFHPRNLPSLMANRSASGASAYPRARSVSSAASSSRLLDVALSSTLAAPEPLPRASASGRSRVVSGVGLAGPSPLGAASAPLHSSSRRDPPRPSGRFVAPEVSLSSWSPSQQSPPSSPLPSPSHPFHSSPRNPADLPSAADDVQSQFSYALSHTSLPADVQSHLSYSFSSRLSQGDPVPDPSLPLSLSGGPSNLTPAAHAAILLQRLPTAAQCAEGSVEERVVYALRILAEAGYAADVGSAGNTRPAGGADRWVFVPSTRPDEDDREDRVSATGTPAAAGGGLGLDVPVPPTTASPQLPQPSPSRLAHRDPNPSPTTTSSSRGQPSNRGRPATRASTAASRSRTNSTVSPSTSTRSRAAAAAAAAAQATGVSGSRPRPDAPPSSSPAKSSSVRSRSPSESPRPTRRARLDRDSPSIASFHSFASTKSLSTSASATGSQRRLPTPSPEKTPPQLPDLALHPLEEDASRPDSPPETSEEELPLALRRPVRATTSAANGGTSSAGSSLRNVPRERTGSNASSNPSSVSALDPPRSSTPATPDTPEFAQGSTTTGVSRRRSTRSALDPPPSAVASAAHRRIAGSLRRVRTPAPDDDSAEGEGNSTPTLQRRSTTTSAGSVRRLAIPSVTNTPVQSAPARRLSPQPPVVPPVAAPPATRRSWLSFAAPSAPPSAPSSSSTGRPILPRPAPRSPVRRPSLFLPQSPASTAGFSSMSSENELPLDRCPPPPYEPMREGAVIVQPPERRRGGGRGGGRAGTAQAGEGRREGGISGRIFSGFGRF